MHIYLIVPLLVALFCLVQSIRDLRRKQYVWAAFGMAGFLALILLPIPTHAINIDLPSAK